MDYGFDTQVRIGISQSDIDSLKEKHPNISISKILRELIKQDINTNETEINNGII